MFHVDLYNVLFISVGYFFYDASFTTTTSCLKYLVDSIKKENPDFKINAYGGQGVIFAGMCITTLFSAFVVEKAGPRPTMIFGACCQLFYNLQFLYPLNWLFYFGAALRGFGACLYSTGKGRYLSQNSTDETLARNFGIYSWFVAVNRITGNLYFFIKYETLVIDKSQRTDFFVTCSIATIISIIFFCLLREAKYNKPVEAKLKESCIYTWTIFAMRDIWLLFPIIAYNAKFAVFGMSMYGTGIGYTETMTELPEMRKINLSGTLLGCGMFFAGGVLSIFGPQMTKKYYYPAILGCYLFNCVIMILIILNLPKNCIHERTWDDAYIKSNLVLAIICSFFLGAGDIIIYTCYHAIVGFLFTDKVSYAFAAIKLFSASTSAIINEVARFLNLYSMLSMLIIIGAVGCGCYIYSELSPSAYRLKHAQNKEEEAQQSPPAKPN